MKYSIVTLIKGDAEKYQQKILYSISNKFSVTEAIKRKPPAHITLKHAFLTEEIKLIEEYIEEFCKSHKKSEYTLEGFNHFGDNVIFIEVIPSIEMKSTYKKFFDSLKDNFKIQFNEYDGNTHFHSSIAHTDIKEKFDSIWNFISKENPKFNLLFDNISILKLVDGIWEIHKEYALN